MIDTVCDPYKLQSGAVYRPRRRLGGLTGSRLASACPRPPQDLTPLSACHPALSGASAALPTKPAVRRLTSAFQYRTTYSDNFHLRTSQRLYGPSSAIFATYALRIPLLVVWKDGPTIGKFGVGLS